MSNGPTEMSYLWILRRVIATLFLAWGMAVITTSSWVLFIGMLPIAGLLAYLYPVKGGDSK